MFGTIEFTPATLAIISFFIGLIPLILWIIARKTYYRNVSTFFGGITIVVLPLSFAGIIWSATWAVLRWIIGFF